MLLNLLFWRQFWKSQKTQQCWITTMVLLYLQSLANYLKAYGITTYRNGPERIETGRNGPKRTGTDRNGSTKISKRTSMCTETDRNGLQWVPKRTGTDFSSYRNKLQWEPVRKGRAGCDRNNLNKSMYILVGRYAGMYVCRYVCM